MDLEDDIKLLKSIYSAVIDVSGARLSELNYETAINNDLHIYGDDVDEIFLEISTIYSFQWQTFPFSNYFASEGANIHHFRGLLVRLFTLPIRLIWWLASRKNGSARFEAFFSWVDQIGVPRRRIPFTIGLLFAFVRQQTWSDGLVVPQHLADIDKMALARLSKE